jgi:hypothetical protein
MFYHVSDSAKAFRFRLISLFIVIRNIDVSNLGLAEVSTESGMGALPGEELSLSDAGNPQGAHGDGVGRTEGDRGPGTEPGL